MEQEQEQIRCYIVVQLADMRSLDNQMVYNFLKANWILIHTLYIASTIKTKNIIFIWNINIT